MEGRDQAPAPTTGPEFRRLYVRCGREAVAIPLDRVDEVLVPHEFTRVPGTGPEVCGLIGLRGRVVTVFDLCALLGGKGLEASRDYRILVVRAAGRVVGLAVAEVATSPEGAGADGGEVAYRDLDLDPLIGSLLA